MWHGRKSNSVAILALCALCVGLPAGAQRPSRVATTAAALTNTPLFFHGKPIAIRHAFTTSAGDVTKLEGTAKPVFIVWQGRPSRSDGEIRGDFWDIGRVQEGDSRLTLVDFRPILDAENQGRWPAREQMFLISSATIVESPPAQAASIRDIALAPGQFEGRGVTLVGRFKGRNLYGDLPQAPAKSKWDFVLQSADAAVWVTGIRPRGKDFDLDPSARVDTGRWLEVKGTVRRDGPQVWVEADAVRLAAAQEDTAPADLAPVAPKEAPPRVIFSAPVPDDTDVERGAPIRLQFSRDMDPKSFRDRIRVAYAKDPALTPPAFAAAYDPGIRAVVIKFKQPLERFQVVKVDLLEGITATDGQPLPPWTLLFTTGG